MTEYIKGLVRHAMTGFGGFFAASADDTAQLVSAGVALVGLVWSIVDKYIAAKAP
jgi:hypothetical protein